MIADYIPGDEQVSPGGRAMADYIPGPEEIPVSEVPVVAMPKKKKRNKNRKKAVERFGKPKDEGVKNGSIQPYVSESKNGDKDGN